MTDWRKVVQELRDSEQPAEPPVGGPEGSPTGSVVTEIVPEKTAGDFISTAGGPTTRSDIFTQWLAGVTKDPNTQMRVYAATRFPYLSESERMKRYGVHQGEVVYQDDDGKLHYEIPDSFGARAKRFFAQEVLNPRTVLGTAGAVKGPAGSIGGAMLGESINKGIASQLGEHVSLPEAALDVAVAGGEAALGEGLGRGVVRGANYLGAKRGGRLAAAAGKDRATIDLPDVQRLEQAGDRFGINLYPPSTTGSKRLRDKWRLLGDLPDTADDIQAALQGTTDDVTASFKARMDELAPATTNSMSAGAGLVDAAKAGMQTLKDARSAAARPYYDKAKQVTGIDISGTVQKLDTVIDISPEGSQSRAAAEKVKQMLLRKFHSTDPMTGKVTTTVVPEDRLETLDMVKKEINAMWKKDPKTAPEANVQRLLNDTLDDMLTTIDGISSDYKTARQVFRDMSPEIEAHKKGLLGGIAKLEGDKVVNATKRLFASSDSTPETVAQARALIVDKAGRADEWDAALRYEMARQFDSIRAASSQGPQNIGYQAFKRLWSGEQRDIFKAAMSPQQVDNFDAFFEVLDRTKHIFGKESMTFPRMEIAKELEREGGSAVLTVAEKATSPTKLVNMISDTIAKANNALRGKYNKQLTAALTDTSGDVSQQLQNMMQLPEGSNELAARLAVFMSTTVLGDTYRNVSKARTSDLLPEPLRPQLQDLTQPRR